MLNVLDEKWKDHLYDLDQLRAAIHYRSWGQKDPLVEYKQEAYTMFVDLMNDLSSTFTERFLKAQLVFDPMPPMDPYAGAFAGGYGDDGMSPQAATDRPARRYNALGILEEVSESDDAMNGTGSAEHAALLAEMDEAAEALYDDDEGDEDVGVPQGAVDVGPAETPAAAAQAGAAPVVARRDPAVVGAGPVRSLATPQPRPSGDWSDVGRNDPCPCGSGKKFKKCHGAQL